MDEYLNTYYDMLTEDVLKHNENLYLEKLITFGNKTYPKYNNVIIMAGGGGSGKGFQIANMLGIDAKVFDIDELKKFVLQSEYFHELILKNYNVDTYKLQMTNPKDVSTLHHIIKDLRLKERYADKVLNAVKDSVERPNLIFDKTCSSLNDIMSVSNMCQKAGYKIENIHLIWVLNDYKTALFQNTQRDRRIDNDILLASHLGTASVFEQIITKPVVLEKFVNGDIYISFNKAEVDTKIDISNTNKLVVTDFDYVQIKEQGKDIIPVYKIKQEVLDKIAEYVPSKQQSYMWKHLRDI